VCSVLISFGQHGVHSLGHLVEVVWAASAAQQRRRQPAALRSEGSAAVEGVAALRLLQKVFVGKSPKQKHNKGGGKKKGGQRSPERPKLDLRSEAERQRQREEAQLQERADAR
jgi:hypothetical protein